MRTLFTAACALGGAAAAAHYLLPLGWLPWLGAALLALSLPAALLRGDWRVRALTLLISAALGVSWYWGYTLLFVRPAAELGGRDLTLTARVLECPRRDEDFAMTYVRLDTEGLPAVRAAVYDYDGYMGYLRPGDRVELAVRASSATEKYGSETDIYASRGILLRATLRAESRVLGRDWRSALSFPAELARGGGLGGGAGSSHGMLAALCVRCS